MAGQHPPFEILEHTADAGIIARGATPAEAFAHAAQGMYALMVDLEDVRETDSREVRVEAKDLPSLLTSWLLELLFLTETQGLVFRAFDVEINGMVLRARARGERVDPGRHKLGGVVKGVTRHLLDVTEEDGACRVSVLFDM
jgi:SHS2 domain-containing protein